MAAMRLEPSTRVHRLGNVLESEIGDKTVMMGIDQGSYFGLNTTGSRIWALLAEPVSIDTLCDRLSKEFEVQPEQCEPEVVAFLQNLLERGLVQVVTDETR